VALWACRKSPLRSDGERATVFLTTAALLLLILGFSPSLRGQTFLPVYPLVILCGVGWLREGVERWLPAVYPGVRATACVALAAALTTVLVVRARPWADGLRDQRELLQDTLRLTAKDEFVLDSKGETIFRRRPFYYAYVDVTRSLFASGGLKDAAREGLAETKTRVVLGDLSKFPEPTRSYLKRHYRPLGAGRLRGLAPL
jgi:hypothetical protein